MQMLRLTFSRRLHTIHAAPCPHEALDVRAVAGQRQVEERRKAAGARRARYFLAPLGSTLIEAPATRPKRPVRLTHGGFYLVAMPQRRASGTPRRGGRAFAP